MEGRYKMFAVWMYDSIEEENVIVNGPFETEEEAEACLANIAVELEDEVFVQEPIDSYYVDYVR